MLFDTVVSLIYKNIHRDVSFRSVAELTKKHSWRLILLKLLMWVLGCCLVWDFFSLLNSFLSFWILTRALFELPGVQFLNKVP